jgi:transposase
MFVEGMLWIVRTGSPWRDLPEVFRDWNSVLRRFSRWSVKSVWWRIFEAMSDDPDFEYLIVDSTIVRAHQYAAALIEGLRAEVVMAKRPTTPITCAKPSPPRAHSPSSPTTRHARSSIRSTSIS